MKIPLKQYAKERGLTQMQVSRAIGVTQGGLSMMLNSDRKIFVELDESGELAGAYEIRPIGSTRLAQVKQ